MPSYSIFTNIGFNVFYYRSIVACTCIHIYPVGKQTPQIPPKATLIHNALISNHNALIFNFHQHFLLSFYYPSMEFCIYPVDKYKLSLRPFIASLVKCLLLS